MNKPSKRLPKFLSKILARLRLYEDMFAFSRDLEIFTWNLTEGDKKTARMSSMSPAPIPYLYSPGGMR